MKKYIVGLCLFLSTGLQAITTVEELKKDSINDIQTQLQKQGITNLSTLYKQKESLGKTESYRNEYDGYDTYFVDGSVIKEEYDRSVYIDTHGNQAIFTNAVLRSIVPSDNYLLSYALRQAVDLSNQGPQAEQAYNNTVAVIQELLKQGIKPQPQDIALASQKPALLKLLTATAYAPSQEPLFTAIESGNIAQAYAIITKNPDALFAVGPEQKRPLTIALTKAAHARGCLLGATKASPSESASNTNMVLMLLDTAATLQDVTLLDDRARHILTRCSELTKELIERTKNKQAIQEMQKIIKP